MRIDDNQPPDDPSVNTEDMESEDVDSQSAQSTQSDDEPSKFSQLLAKKKSQDRDSQFPRAEKKNDNTNFAAGLMRPELVRDGSGAVSGIEAKRVVALPADLQGLVREISVAMNKAGNQQVQIEMNS